jgi:hypothetical protein
MRVRVDQVRQDASFVVVMNRSFCAQGFCGVNSHHAPYFTIRK